MLPDAIDAAISNCSQKQYSLKKDIFFAAKSHLKYFVRKKKINKSVQKEIDEINQELAQFESIKKFTIITEEFSTDNFLTPSLKIKRKLVVERFKDEIDAMYAQ